MDGDGVWMVTDVMEMGREWGGDRDGCDGGGDGQKLVGMGWVWGEQVVPVQLSKVGPWNSAGGSAEAL